MQAFSIYEIDPRSKDKQPRVRPAKSIIIRLIFYVLPEDSHLGQVTCRGFQIEEH